MYDYDYVYLCDAIDNYVPFCVKSLKSTLEEVNILSNYHNMYIYKYDKFIEDVYQKVIQLNIDKKIDISSVDHLEITDFQKVVLLIATTAEIIFKKYVFDYEYLIKKSATGVLEYMNRITKIEVNMINEISNKLFDSNVL